MLPIIENSRTSETVGKQKYLKFNRRKFDLSFKSSTYQNTSQLNFYEIEIWGVKLLVVGCYVIV